MRISDWSSDVCSSDLEVEVRQAAQVDVDGPAAVGAAILRKRMDAAGRAEPVNDRVLVEGVAAHDIVRREQAQRVARHGPQKGALARADRAVAGDGRSDEHTSELQSLMRKSYADFCLK